MPPEQFETIPDKDLVYRYRKMAGHNTLWGQVHASRGCPHNCDYCALVRHFGRRVRTRTPENVLEDIRRTIAFQEEGHHRYKETADAQSMPLYVAYGFHDLLFAALLVIQRKGRIIDKLDPHRQFPGAGTTEMRCTYRKR